jgi:threonine/homoserine/homoserine lactone efflux protein
MASTAVNGEDIVMNPHLLGLYLVVAILLMLTPGPDMMFVLSTGARGGSKVGFLAACGVASSEAVHIALAAAGLSALFAAAPTAFTVLRLVGAAYLLFLGVQALRSARRGTDPAKTTASNQVSGRRAYLRGALTNLVNPKMVTFSIAFLPQFIDRSLGHVFGQFAVLGAIFIAFELLVDGTVGLAGGRLGEWMSRRRRVRQGLDAGSGGIMIALAGRLALER